MIEYVKNNDETFAIIVRSLFNKQGVHFFTPDDFSQQLAYMSHPAGKTIEPHVHNVATREVQYTKEVLFIRRGKLRVDFYTEDKKYIESKILEAGDVLLLSSGGHGFEVLEEIEMFEVKQGPYAGDKDKTRFNGVKIKDIRFKKDEK